MPAVSVMDPEAAGGVEVSVSNPLTPLAKKLPPTAENREVSGHAAELGVRDFENLDFQQYLLDAADVMLLITLGA